MEDTEVGGICVRMLLMRFRSSPSLLSSGDSVLSESNTH